MIFDTLKEYRAEYPQKITPAQSYELLNRTAFAHRTEGWGLLSKPAGNQFNGRALDILFNINERHIYDVLVDGPDAVAGTNGLATPAWQDKGEMDVTRWVAPAQMAIELPPPAPVEGVPVDDPPMTIDLVALARQITRIEQMVSDLELDHGYVEADLIEVKQRQDRPLVGSVFGVKVVLRPEGK